MTREQYRLDDRAQMGPTPTTPIFVAISLVIGIVIAESAGVGVENPGWLPIVGAAGVVLAYVAMDVAFYTLSWLTNSNYDGLLLSHGGRA